MSSDAALARLEGVCSRLEALEVRLSSSSGAGAPARWARRPHARETRALVRTFSKTFEEVRGGSCSPFSPRRARSRAAGFRAPCVQCCVPAHARHRCRGRRMGAADGCRCVVFSLSTSPCSVVGHDADRAGGGAVEGQAGRAVRHQRLRRRPL